ncbi:MAG: DNA repair protein RecN [Lachnospiraceae bacterium]|nr:DNA repair protein RecN [Lachnospiraceae bacterium]
MLSNIHVKNFAIIDEADIDLADNLNIFTGETGAGKSLLLGALNMALGARTPKDIISTSTEYALSELTFTDISEKVRQKLNEAGISADDEVVISKKLMNNGRSIVRINGETSSAAYVKDLAGLLIDIYGQNEHQSLLKKDNQKDILDEYAGEKIAELKTKVKKAYNDYKALKNEADGLNSDEQSRKRRIDLLEYEIKEIENAGLEKDEEERLKDRHRFLANAMLISEGLEEGYEALNGNERASDSLSEAIRALTKISGFDGELEKILDSLSDIDSCLSDVIRDIGDYRDKLPDDREELTEVEERLDLISRLKSKYGNSIEQIEDYFEKAEKELANLQDFEGYSIDLKNRLEKAEKELESLTGELTEKRKKEAVKLGKKISEALMELNFNQVEFKIDISEKKEYHPDGRDECTFMISLNPGESIKPVQEVASGGELSRIMLGIKSVMAGKDSVGTLIFDEIDAGISGRTAQMVSEKLCRIAGEHQVICITHLPQIASMADNHYEISKTIQDGKTRTGIRRLKDSGIKDELARLIGGAELTEKVYESALEMKTLADKRKTEIRNDKK